MSSREQTIAEVFLLAVELPEWDRSELLDSRDLDSDTRREIEELLAYDESHPPDFLSSPLRSPPSVGAAPGEVIAGRYRLEAEIGEGSSGVVFRAVQFDPIERLVAIKILKAGLDTRQILARFEGERQTLAMLDHPNIARIIDAGVTERGRPFFVMDLIAGRPLMAFCDERRLSIDARLRLFESVCEAVHHAHTKGVIHRDIKPGNIIVCEDGPRPSARVIDFGVAKVLREQSPGETRNTRRGQLLGTPAYMSPEQARGEVDIDTRSDIYSLGAVLYELLTGTRAIEHGEERRVSPAQLERLICEADAPKPSVRVHRFRSGAEFDARSSAVTRERGTSPVGLERVLRGDLDAIVMMAMAKDRARRYQAVPELAADLRAFRRELPVVARAPSARYRASRFVARNRLAVSSALIIGVLAITASVTIAVLGVRSMNAGALASKNANEADHQRAIAVAVQDFMQDMLVAAPEIDASGTNVTVLEVLASATEELNAGKLRDQPEVEAAIRFVLGKTYYKMSWTPLATEHFQWVVDWHTATKPYGDPLRLDAYWYLGEVLKESGQIATAIPCFEHCHTESLETNGVGDSRVWFALDQIGNCLYRLGRAEEALDYHERAYEGLVGIFGPDSSLTGAAVFNIGAVLGTLGHHAESERHLLSAISLLDDGRPVDLLASMRARCVLATRIYAAQGRDHEAEQLLLETKERALRLLGPRHGESAGIDLYLGAFRRGQGRLDEALESFLAYRAFVEGMHGPADSESLKIRAEVASVFLAQRDWTAAADLYAQIERDTRAALARSPADASEDRVRVLHLYVARASRGQALVLLAQGDARAAEPFTLAAIEFGERWRPDDELDPDRLEARRLWCACRTRLGHAAEVVGWLATARQAVMDQTNGSPAVVARLTDTLGCALIESGRTHEGATLILSVAQQLESDYGGRTLQRWPSSLAYYPQIGAPEAIGPNP